MLTLEELHAEQHATLLLLRGGNVVRIKNAIIQLGIVQEYKEHHPASWEKKKKVTKSLVIKYREIKKQ